MKSKHILGIVFGIIILGIGLLVFNFMTADWFNSYSPVIQDEVKFSHKIIKLDDVFLDVQIADNDSSRVRGLMFQEQLSFDEGMLFIFDKPDLYSIWMPNMKFYLDVIWFDSEGHVVHIEENIRPCQTALEIQTCPDISPNGNSLYILEVTSGFVDKFNITKDSKFSWVSDNPSYGQ